MTDSFDPINGQETPEDSQNKNGRIVTTLGKQGPMLPMGIEVGEKFEKGFDHGPWKMKQEKALGKIREENKGMSIGVFVTHLMSMMMTKVGPYVFDSNKSDAEKNLIVSQCYLGDILYMYMWLRKSCLGSNVDSALRCPACKHINKRTLNLDDLDVYTVVGPDSLAKEVELQDGLMIFGELRKKVSVRPPYWGVMSNPEMTVDNDAVRTALLIKECVFGAEGIETTNPVAILDSDLDELSKMDLERLSAAIEDSPGPQMVVELECTKCRQVTMQMVDWQYDSFFSMSSASPAGRS